jgi:hypothetical protein
VKDLALALLLSCNCNLRSEKLHFLQKEEFHGTLTSDVFDLDGFEASDLAVELWSFISVDFSASLSALLSFDGLLFAAVNEVAFDAPSFFLSYSGEVGWGKKNAATAEEKIHTRREDFQIVQ